MKGSSVTIPRPDRYWDGNYGHEGSLYIVAIHACPPVLGSENANVVESSHAATLTNFLKFSVTPSKLPMRNPVITIKMNVDCIFH